MSTALIHDRYTIYFGSSADKIHPAQYTTIKTVPDFNCISAFAHLKQTYNLNHLLFLRQTHSTQGMVAHDATAISSYIPFSATGDYLITSLTGTGIGVMTADCLPVILYDPEHHVVAVAHAGWRGAVAGIMSQVVASLQKHNASRVELLRVFLGPSARTCCYQVGSEVITAITKTPYARTLYQKSAGTFFDLGLFVSLQLEGLGIPRDNIDIQNNVCTICNDAFFSYRRQGACAGRQMSVAWLV